MFRYVSHFSFWVRVIAEEQHSMQTTRSAIFASARAQPPKTNVMLYVYAPKCGDAPLNRRKAFRRHKRLCIYKEDAMHNILRAHIYTYTICIFAPHHIRLYIWEGGEFSADACFKHAKRDALSRPYFSNSFEKLRSRCI